MKYELTDTTKVFDGVILYQIKALEINRPRSLEIGALGGYIEKEANLSQEGSCWVDPNAVVLEDAFVSENASVRNTSVLRGDAQLSGNAMLRGKCLMTTDHLEGERILMQEDITKPVIRVEGVGVHWDTWITDNQMHNDCIGHDFEVWRDATDDQISEMHETALDWWRDNKDTLMGILKIERGFE